MISLMAVFAVITAYWAKYYHLTHDRRTLEKSYAFSRFGPFCKISKDHWVNGIYWQASMGFWKGKPGSRECMLVARSMLDPLQVLAPVTIVYVRR
jgi:hypothetical protein